MKNLRIKKIKNFFKIANYNLTPKSWDEFNKKFEDKNFEIQNMWNNYIQNYDTNNIRDNSFNSFIDFYKSIDSSYLPEESFNEEKILLLSVKKKIKELLSIKRERIEYERSRYNEELKKKKLENILKIPAREEQYAPDVDRSVGIFGSISPRWLKGGYSSGPSHHQNRPGRTLTNWQSNNAWDIFGDAGTKIYSMTNGIVTKVSTSSSKSPNIFGMSITIAGSDGYPSVFYTHVDNVNVKQGDRVSVGDFIAEITQPKSRDMPSHVHVGIQSGSISSLIDSSGRFKEFKV